MLETLKQRVWQANLELPARHLVTYTWGNVSAIDRQQQLVVIKPSGVEYAKMQPQDMVVVDMFGKVVEGDYCPSCDTATHLVLYQNYPEVGGIVHTHSTYATAWAQAGLAIPALGTTHADYFLGDIPCSRPLTEKEIMGSYEQATGEVIIETLLSHTPLYTPAVIVFQHGPFTWGKTPEQAVQHAVVLEEIAKIAWLSRSINPVSPSIDPILMDKHFSRKHGATTYYGQHKTKD